jgi:hypothetical protein
MPGNLEALLILPEHAYGVKTRSGGNPYHTRVFDQWQPTARRHQAGVKGAEGGEADPSRRRSQPRRPSRPWTNP